MFIFFGDAYYDPYNSLWEIEYDLNISIHNLFHVVGEEIGMPKIT
jgi:hypothetical protein